MALADPETVLVADSWLVAGGRTRALDAHWERFGDSCRAHGVGDDELRLFRTEVTAAVPPDGRWFPRVQLTTDGLEFLLRPAPPPSDTVRVLVGPTGDPRVSPRVKGPDLELLFFLRERARQDGADELLLCDDAGALREGALSSLLWWEDDALCTTPGEHTLPGVTRALVLALARGRGTELRVRSPLPAELAGREVWLTSALHGIRAVSEWVAPAQPAGAALRAEGWQRALDAGD